MLVLWTKGHLLPPPNACAHIWVQGCKGKCLLHGDHPWPKSLASADLGPLLDCQQLDESLWAPGGAPSSADSILRPRALRKLLCTSATLPAAARRQALVTPAPLPSPVLSSSGASVYHSLPAGICFWENSR